MVSDEVGGLQCYDRVSDPRLQHKMSNSGAEPSRESLHSRCPAKLGRWECSTNELCKAAESHGKTLQVPQAIDLQWFSARGLHNQPVWAGVAVPLLRLLGCAQKATRP